MWAIPAHTPNQSRWYQTEAIQSIYDYFQGGNKGNPAIALPTAAGKTHVISGFMKRALYEFPFQRFIVSTHVKELVKQNADKLERTWSQAPFGINAASLKRRDTMQAIVIGSIQSMYKNFDALGHRDIMIIDEAHLVSPEDGTMYQQFIAGLRIRNPHLKVIGLSATLWRQKNGMITDPGEGRIFTDIIYNLCTMEGFARLINEGYLAPLYPKRTSFELDVGNVSLGNNGDFNQKQMQTAVNHDKITHAALMEAMRFGVNRRSWLTFASGIEHAEKITEMLNRMGVPTVCVHSKIDNDERDRRIAAHKSGEARCMVGNNIFTTGYDHPPLDFIIDLQPTMAVAKHVQKLGRAMRVSPETGKQNGLVLDFGGNVRRCGPINDPYIPKAKRPGDGDAPVKICEHCSTYNHAAARFCDGCGEPFEFKVKIVGEATDDEILRSDLPIVEIFNVDSVMYFKQISRKTEIPYLQAAYMSGLQRFTENIFLENPGFASKLARDWWRQRHAIEPPPTIDEALKFVKELRVPKALHVWVNKKDPVIQKVDWSD